MKIKAMNKVPVLLDGEVVETTPGQVYDVPEDIGEALLRGEDAAKVTERIPPATVDIPQDAAPSPKPKKRTRRSKKNLGGAPENKDAGPAPEDKDA